MEYPLTWKQNLLRKKEPGLNPYSNGISSDLLDLAAAQKVKSLNPYSNGIPSDLRTSRFCKKTNSVLILILMEYPLTNKWQRLCPKNTVLILILMEYPLTF